LTKIAVGPFYFQAAQLSTGAMRVYEWENDDKQSIVQRFHALQNTRQWKVTYVRCF